MSIPNPFNLQNKIAVVTGGAGLLGQAFVKALSFAGATVLIADINSKLAHDVAKNISQETGGNITAVVLDITSETSVIECAENITKQFGKIDIWVNNAYPRTKDWGNKFESIPFSSWQENINSHLNGYALCCQKICEQMKKQKSGSVINIASIYGLIGPDFSIYDDTSMTMPAAYAAIKGGITNLTRYLASYYGPHGVRINTISPGGIFDHQPESFVKKYSSKTPLRRLGNAEDIVGGLIYLASDAAGYVTGHNLLIDGGWTAI